MDVNRLLSDELSYELRIRRLPADGTVAEKRVILRGALTAEKYIAAKLDSPDSDPTEELATCEKKIEDLMVDVAGFDLENRVNEYRRISSRLIHIRGRLALINCQDKTQGLRKEDLINKTMSLLENVSKKYESVSSMHSLIDDLDEAPEQRSIIDEPVPLLPQTVSRVESIREEPIETAEEVRGLRPLQNTCHLSNAAQFSTPTITRQKPSSVAQPTCAEETPVFRNYAVSKWNIQYDGRSSVANFLERVEELRQSRGVPESHLLHAASELLKGDALIWYRSVKHTFTNWEDFKQDLRATFQPFDYEASLWDEIRARTQGQDEKVVVYVAVMENLFGRLSQCPSEQTRLSIIRRNMLPSLQIQLALSPVESLATLIRLGRTIEEANFVAHRYCPPPTNIKHVLEPDLAYRKCDSTTRVSAVTANTDVELIDFSVAPVSTSRPLSAGEPRVPSWSANLTCWNCGGTGHRSISCRQPKKVHCYRCGMPDVKVSTCPKCSENLNVGRTVAE